MIRRICVYCGSKLGDPPRYRETAAALGAELARRGIHLVYGGGRVGTMGVLADAVLAAGGEVVGVIPQVLATAEVAHAGLGDLRVVDTMHERKALMASLADAFIALPGGMGTLEELAEILTWAQIGIHAKPVAVLDLDGYYQPLLRFLDHAVAEGFLSTEHRGLARVATSIPDVFAALER